MAQRNGQAKIAAMITEFMSEELSKRKRVKKKKFLDADGQRKLSQSVHRLSQKKKKNAAAAVKRRNRDTMQKLQDENERITKRLQNVHKKVEKIQHDIRKGGDDVEDDIAEIERAERVATELALDSRSEEAKRGAEKRKPSKTSKRKKSVRAKLGRRSTEQKLSDSPYLAAAKVDVGKDEQQSRAAAGGTKKRKKSKKISKSPPEKDLTPEVSTFQVRGHGVSSQGTRCAHCTSLCCDTLVQRQAIRCPQSFLQRFSGSARKTRFACLQSMLRKALAKRGYARMHGRYSLLHLYLLMRQRRKSCDFALVFLT